VGWGNKHGKGKSTWSKTTKVMRSAKGKLKQIINIGPSPEVSGLKDG